MRLSDRLLPQTPFIASCDVNELNTLWGDIYNKVNLGAVLSLHCKVARKRKGKVVFRFLLFAVFLFNESPVFCVPLCSTLMESQGETTELAVAIVCLSLGISKAPKLKLFRVVS